MPETRSFGPPSLGIEIAPIGVGVWPWGSRWYWGYGKSYGEEDVRQAFRASLSAGVTLFDTAEIYGRGESERILGKLAGELDSRFRGNDEDDAALRQAQGERKPAQVERTAAPTEQDEGLESNEPGTELPRPFVATKFMPFPWRWRAGDVPRALTGSLQRLGMERADLYQIHWPIVPARPRLKRWVNGLIRARDQGLLTTVGVSNFDADLMRRAHNLLSRAGIPLASNQLPFSLLDRHIEHNGLLDACKELDVTVISYSPLAEGLLTGKYTPDDKPTGYRGMRLRKKVITAQPIVAALRDVATRHENRTPAQIALRWLIQKGSVPIPGAKNAQQATDNAGALGWTLTDDDMALLDEASA